MFGIYSNQRLSENERKILKSNPDDYNWYCVMLNVFFKDYGFFQVREDIEIPQKEDDEGVLLMSDGKIIYFKTIDCDITDEVVNSILEVCTNLEDLFNQPITSYVLYPPDCDVLFDCEKINPGKNVIKFCTGSNQNGEKIIDRLEVKLKNHDEFTISDSIDHMILPYIGFKNSDVFEKKYENYMKLIEEYGAD